MQTASSAQWTINEVCAWLGSPVPPELVKKAERPLEYFTSEATSPRAASVHFSADSKPKLIDRLKKARTLAVVDTEQRFDSAGKPFPTIVCSTPLESYVQLMRQIRLETDAWVVAVTGSDGKTITKEMLRWVLQSTYKTHWSRGTSSVFGQIGIGIQSMPADSDLYIQEVGATSPGRVAAAVEMLVPHAVVYTNIGMAHSGSFEGPDAVFEEKLLLDNSLPDDGVVFVNVDDPILSTTTFRHSVITYGINRPEVDFTAIDIKVSGGNQAFSILERSTGEQIPVVVHALGDHNVSNALAAFAVGRWLGVSATDAAQGIGRFRPSGTRQNLVSLGGHKVLVDCFNSSEASVIGMAQALATISVPHGGRRLMVLGDIPTLGDFSETVHRELSSKLASIGGIDAIYCVGKDTKWLAEEASHGGKPAFHFENKETLGHKLESILRPNDAIAFKAGPPTALATVIDRIFGTEYMLTNSRYLKRKPIKAEGMQFSLIPDYGAELVSLGSLDDNIRLRFGDSVNDAPLVRIGKGACKESDLVEVILYDPILSIGSSAFQSNVNLQYVEFPRTLRLIGVDAFRGCTALEEVYLPEGLQTIQKGAFRDCSELRSIIIPRSTRTIGRGVFLGCGKLQVHCYSDAPTTKQMLKLLPDSQLKLID